MIDAVAVCDGTSVTVLPLGGDDDRDALDAWLMDSSIDKRIHDAKGPDLALLTRTGGGAVIRGVSVDTAADFLAAFFFREGSRLMRIIACLPVYGGPVRMRPRPGGRGS